MGSTSPAHPGDARERPQPPRVGVQRPLPPAERRGNGHRLAPAVRVVVGEGRAAPRSLLVEEEEEGLPGLPGGAPAADGGEVRHERVRLVLRGGGSARAGGKEGRLQGPADPLSHTLAPRRGGSLPPSPRQQRPPPLGKRAGGGFSPGSTRLEPEDAGGDGGGAEVLLELVDGRRGELRVRGAVDAQDGALEAAHVRDRGAVEDGDGGHLPRVGGGEAEGGAAAVAEARDDRRVRLADPGVRLAAVGGDGGRAGAQARGGGVRWQSVERGGLWWLERGTSRSRNTDSSAWRPHWPPGRSASFHTREIARGTLGVGWQGEGTKCPGQPDGAGAHSGRRAVSAGETRVLGSPTRALAAERVRGHRHEPLPRQLVAEVDLTEVGER